MVRRVNGAGNQPAPFFTRYRLLLRRNEYFDTSGM
jgi:hypothetical protein